MKFGDYIAEDALTNAKITILKDKLKQIHKKMKEAQEAKDKEKFLDLKQQAKETTIAIVDAAKG
jgi:hypothetical protein